MIPQENSPVLVALKVSRVHPPELLASRAAGQNSLSFKIETLPATEPLGHNLVVVWMAQNLLRAL